MEILEQEAEESHKLVPSDPSLTRDVSIRGRGREEGKVSVTGAPMSASLGAMRSLIGKLDMLLTAPPKGCSFGMVNDGMRLLKYDVEKLSSYLDELVEVEEPPPTAKSWSNQARELSYKIEDYIDKLFIARNTRTLYKFFKYIKTPGELKQTVYKFRIYVQEAIERYEVYVLSYFNFKNTLRRRFVSLGPMLLTPYEDIVIDDQMNELIDLLANNEDKQMKVVSVLGSACLGKTTLARVVYNKIGKRYSCRAYIRVSAKPDMKRIFHDMLSQLQQQHRPQEDCKEVDLIEMIKEYLQDKRYLIIIDDVWTAVVRDIINQALPKGSRGSRIIITTEIEDIALTCCSHQPERVFVMKPVDDHHSRKLFFRRIFGSESDCPEEFRDICNDIIEICSGLPLATVSIASLLACQPVLSVGLFEYIHQSLSSCMSSAGSSSERTRQALNLSFNNLPNYLKTCLMYLSMYPEGHKFYKDDLVSQYVAEGFIDTTEGRDIHKVAESYLDELIGRRFIQPICINYNNEVLFCAVHDTVHDLIAHKSAEQNFIVATDYNQNKVPISHNVRRLSLLFGDAKHARAPANIKSLQVRSLAYSGLLECMPCIMEFKLLRVLNLQLLVHARNNNPVDLTGISELFQLRYLKIACDVCIKLPNHMARLKCLEALDIKDAIVTAVPWIHLPHLLQLSVPVERNLLDWIVSTKSVSLANLGKVNQLQDLHLTIPSTPPPDNQRRNMEALGFLIGGNGNLKTFVVAHGYSVKNVALHGASRVTISWYNVAPPPHLQRFECSPHSCIIFYKIPSWIRMLGNLCILKIAVRGMQMTCVDILRGLPALIALSLYVHTAPYEKIIFGKVGFSVLKYFKLRLTSGIAWLTFEAGAMPNLEKLKLGFTAIPKMDHGILKRHQHGSGTALINVGHMPSVREISTKFGGTTADRAYTLISNHPGNPAIKMHMVDYSSSDDKTTKQENKTAEIMEEEPIGSNKQQPVEILEKESDEYDHKLDTPTGKRISGPSIAKEKERSSLSEEKEIEISRPFISKEKERPSLSEEKVIEISRPFISKEKERPSLSEEKVIEISAPSMLKQKDIGISMSPEVYSPPDYFLAEARRAAVNQRQYMEQGRNLPVYSHSSSMLDSDNYWEVSSQYSQGLESVGNFTLNELMSATNNFSPANILGENEFGCIYKGIILGLGPVVAVRTAMYRQTDLWDLRMMRHPHLVRLLGYCYQDNHVILVYEYMPKGNLKHHLFNTPPLALPWLTRLNIAIGAAEGLAFLHDSGQWVTYNGFKASNILLDSNYKAKLWGFQSAMDDVRWQTYTSRVEREMHDFGAVLLELLSGRPCMSKKRRNPVKWQCSFLDTVPVEKLRTSPVEMLHRIIDTRREDKLPDIMDPSLEGRYSVHAAWRAATIASKCLRSVPQEQVSMHVVVKALEALLGDDRKDGTVSKEIKL